MKFGDRFAKFEDRLAKFSDYPLFCCRIIADSVSELFLHGRRLSLDGMGWHVQARSMYWTKIEFFSLEFDILDKNRDFVCFVSDHYPKYVISMDELDMSRNGIRHRNIRDFLLDMTW